MLIDKLQFQTYKIHVQYNLPICKKNSFNPFVTLSQFLVVYLRFVGADNQFSNAVFYLQSLKN